MPRTIKELTRAIDECTNSIIVLEKINATGGSMALFVNSDGESEFEVPHPFQNRVLRLVFDELIAIRDECKAKRTELQAKEEAEKPKEKILFVEAHDPIRYTITSDQLVDIFTKNYALDHRKTLILDDRHLAYLEGLFDAGVAGSEYLMKKLREHGKVTVSLVDFK